MIVEILLMFDVQIFWWLEKQIVPLAPLLFGIKDANDVNLFKGITLQQKDHFRKKSFFIHSLL